MDQPWQVVVGSSKVLGQFRRVVNPFIGPRGRLVPTPSSPGFASFWLAHFFILGRALFKVGTGRFCRCLPPKILPRRAILWLYPFGGPLTWWQIPLLGFLFKPFSREVSSNFPPMVVSIWAFKGQGPSLGPSWGFLDPGLS